MIKMRYNKEWDACVLLKIRSKQMRRTKAMTAEKAK